MTIGLYLLLVVAFVVLGWLLTRLDGEVKIKEDRDLPIRFQDAESQGYHIQHRQFDENDRATAP